MKPYRYLLACAAAACCLACSVTRTRTFTPSATQLNIAMSDLEYLGQTEISVEYRTYLGFISVIDRINGEPYTGVEKQVTNINGGYLAALQLTSRLDRASYKVLSEYPDANYFVLVKQTKHKTRLFLGGEITEKATIKAYAFR